MTDKQFAKDVAKHLDRRQQRRKLGFWGGVAALLTAAALYLRCGQGWGLGGGGIGTGSGKGSGTGFGSGLSLGPNRCQIRVEAGKILLDGKPATRAQTVEACRRTAGADVVVTGDARHGDW